MIANKRKMGRFYDEKSRSGAGRGRTMNGRGRNGNEWAGYAASRGAYSFHDSRTSAVAMNAPRMPAPMVNSNTNNQQRRGGYQQQQQHRERYMRPNHPNHHVLERALSHGGRGSGRGGYDDRFSQQRREQLRASPYGSGRGGRNGNASFSARGEGGHDDRRRNAPMSMEAARGGRGGRGGRGPQQQKRPAATGVVAVNNASEKPVKMDEKMLEDDLDKYFEEGRKMKEKEKK